VSRPRTVSDTGILEAVTREVPRLGPRGLTLAAAGAACGLSAPALVGRFGSRAGLLRARAWDAAERVTGRFAAARAAETSPLLALVEALAAEVRGLEEPGALANHLGFLQMELADEALRPAVLHRHRALAGEVRALLDEAAALGELIDAETAGLSRTVLTTHQGALATWAILREGSLEDWLRDEVEAVLSPYLPAEVDG
jgi:AcrR family transcriptional regulator